MQQFILFIKGLVIGGLSLFSSPYQLEVNIENLERTKGTLYITLFNSEEGFKNDNFYRFKKLQVTKNMEPIRFETLPTGNYALKVFHDVNNNGQLDVSLFGIPKEPYGFSNNAMGAFGSPNFEQCSIAFTENKTIAIRLR